MLIYWFHILSDVTWVKCEVSVICGIFRL